MRLEGGLILVVDDLAAGVLHQLDFVGALQTHLISDAFPVRSSDGTIIGSQASSLLRSGEGTTPSLFEEINIQRYELAQDLSDSAPTMASVAAAGVGSCAAGGFVLVMSLAGSDTSETETGETGAGSTTGTLHPYAGLALKVDLLHPGADLKPFGKTSPEDMHAMDGKLYFGGDEVSGERELYVYDPSTGTTTKVASADLNNGGATYPKYLEALDGKLYFEKDLEELYVYFPDDLTV
jgi:outer membrane protein assembly factor BamB